MFSHIMLGTNDLVASRRFYDAVMPTLGYACEDAGDSYAGYGLKVHIGSGQNCLWLGLPADGEAATSGNGTNVALLAQSREQVDNYSAALPQALDEVRDCATYILIFTRPMSETPMGTSWWWFVTVILLRCKASGS